MDADPAEFFGEGDVDEDLGDVEFLNPDYASDEDTPEPAEAEVPRAEWLDEVLATDHEWVGKLIRIWFLDKKKYFKATIFSHEGGDKFELMYKNHLKEGNIALVEAHRYEDCRSPDCANDDDRWSWIANLNVD